MTPVRPAGAAVGIDGCPGGWIAATMTGEGAVSWSFAEVPDIEHLLPEAAWVGIDMPVGLLSSGLRPCDALARHELPGAASRVFTTPPRAVLELGPAAPNADVQALSRALTGQGVSRQALHLAPRILALDAALASREPRLVVEVHPELSFAEMSGGVLDRKGSAGGAQQRLAALGTWLTDVEAVLGARPRGVPAVDGLDALAALWSALRWRDGLARTLPADATAAPFIAV